MEGLSELLSNEEIDVLRRLGRTESMLSLLNETNMESDTYKEKMKKFKSFLRDKNAGPSCSTIMLFIHLFLLYTENKNPKIVETIIDWIVFTKRFLVWKEWLSLMIRITMGRSSFRCDVVRQLNSLLISHHDHHIRVDFALGEKLGDEETLSESLYSNIYFLCNGLLKVRIVGTEDTHDDTHTKIRRFFSIACKLPIGLQQMLCYRTCGLSKDTMPSTNSEKAIYVLASSLIGKKMSTCMCGKH